MMSTPSPISASQLQPQWNANPQGGLAQQRQVLPAFAAFQSLREAPLMSRSQQNFYEFQPVPGTQRVTITFDPVDGPPNHKKGHHHREAIYSQVVEAIENGQVSRVLIHRDKKSLLNPPVAEVFLHTGQVLVTELPKNQEEFTEALEAQRVPFGYTTKEIQMRDRFSKQLKEVLNESLLPIAMFAVTSLGAYSLYQYATNKMRQNKIDDTIQRSILDFRDVDYSLDNALAHQSIAARRKVDSFLHDETKTLIVQGPPGTGKTWLIRALGKEYAKRGNTVVLDVMHDAEVRRLLMNLYSPDEKLYKSAMTTLRKSLGGSFSGAAQKFLTGQFAAGAKEFNKAMDHLFKAPKIDRILVYADEIEKIEADMEEIIRLSKGSESIENIRPSLLILSTCNVKPNLGEAGESRVDRGWFFVDIPPKDILPQIAADWVHGKMPKLSKPSLQASFTELFNDFPGYSTRTILGPEGILRAVVRRVSENRLKADSADALSQALRDELRGVPGDPGVTLDSTEMAGLIRSRFIEHLNNGLIQIDERGEYNLNVRLLETVAKRTQGLNREVRLNAKDFAAVVDAAMAYVEDNNRDLSNLHNLDDSIAEIVNQVRNVALKHSIDAGSLSKANVLRTSLGAKHPKLDPQTHLVVEATLPVGSYRGASSVVYDSQTSLPIVLKENSPLTQAQIHQVEQLLARPARRTQSKEEIEIFNRYEQLNDQAQRVGFGDEQIHQVVGYAINAIGLAYGKGKTPSLKDAVTTELTKIAEAHSMLPPEKSLMKATAELILEAISMSLGQK